MFSFKPITTSDFTDQYPQSFRGKAHPTMAGENTLLTLHGLFFVLSETDGVEELISSDLVIQSRIICGVCVALWCKLSIQM